MKIKITNGYVNEFQGESQVTAGKFGKLEILGEGEAEAEGEDDTVTPPVVPEEGVLEWWHGVLGTLIIIAADLFAGFGWGKGFSSGLVKYWAKKDPKRAAKMLKTAIKKAKAGKYDR